MREKETRMLSIIRGYTRANRQATTVLPDREALSICGRGVGKRSADLRDVPSWLTLICFGAYPSSLCILDRSYWMPRRPIRSNLPTSLIETSVDRYIQFLPGSNSDPDLSSASSF